jgi:hypothetical protein
MNYINLSKLDMLDFESYQYKFHSADANVSHRDASASKPTVKKASKRSVSTFPFTQVTNSTANHSKWTS